MQLHVAQAYHSMLCQLSDIGQDELVFQDPLHITLTQSIAWNAIRNRVLAHLHNALTLSCSLACGTVRVPVELNTFMACPSAGACMWTNVANTQMSSSNSASYLQQTELSHCLLIAVLPLQVLMQTRSFGPEGTRAHQSS